MKRREHAHRFEPDDVLGTRVISALAASPSGGAVAFVLTGIDAEKDDSETTLWTLDLDGALPRQLTFGEHADRAPALGPEGRLAFVSKRAGDDAQIHLLDLRAGGEARSLTSRAGGASTPQWSPDGRRIAFIGPVRPSRAPHDPWVIRSLHYKTDGVGFLSGTSHLFVTEVHGGGPVQLTSGEGDVSGASWSPDGKTIAFCRARTGPREGHRRDLWIVDAEGGPPRRLTESLPSVGTPSWSPCGKRLVFSASTDEGSSIEHVWMLHLATEALMRFDQLETATFVSGGSSPPRFWDERTVLVVRGHRGCSDIVKVDVASGAITPIAGGERQIRLLAFGQGARRMAFTTGEPAGPTEIHVADIDGTNERRASSFARWVDGRPLPRVEKRAFAGIEGWLWRPPPSDAPAPLLVEVHGGPHSFVELGFDGHAWRHVLVSRGWGVLCLNPTGSSTYGEAHAERLRGRWGEADLPEILAAIDQLVEEKIVDGGRVAIAGKSYGGFMAAYAVARSTRFRAAVVAAPVGDLVSHAGTSDSGYYVAPYDQRAELHEAWELYARSSPLRDIHRATAPVLFLQGENDQRCPIGQSEQLFTSMLVNEREAELVIYPGGDHHVVEEGRPSHRVDYVRRLVEWLERHCR